jgi:hypothetical protein
MLQPAFQFHPIFEAPFFNQSYTEAVRHEREISNAGGKNWILPKEINANRVF